MLKLIKENEDEIQIFDEEKFGSEAAMETWIFKHPTSLPNIRFVKRQLRLDGKILDLVGIDNKNNIVVVELKNEKADDKVVTQSLGYAISIQNNLDTIRSIILEQGTDLEGFDIDWDRVGVKIMIIAPSYKPCVKELFGGIKFETELIIIKKFKGYVVLDSIPVVEEKRYKPQSSLLEKDEDYYRDRYGVEGEKMWDIAKTMETYFREREWNLERSNNSNYVSFKDGSSVVAGVVIRNGKTRLYFKVPKETPSPGGTIPYKYEDEYKQALYEVDTGSNLEEFDSLFERAYNAIRER